MSVGLEFNLTMWTLQAQVPYAELAIPDVDAARLGTALPYGWIYRCIIRPCQSLFLGICFCYFYEIDTKNF